MARTENEFDGRIGKWRKGFTPPEETGERPSPPRWLQHVTAIATETNLAWRNAPRPVRVAIWSALAAALSHLPGGAGLAQALTERLP